MAKYKSGQRRRGKIDEHGKEELPPVIQSYLVGAVTEGGRNHALFKAAAQMRDINETEADTLAILGEKARQDGLKDREIETTIASAFRSPPREKPRGNGYSTQPKRRYQRTGGKVLMADEKPRPSPILNSMPIPVPAPIEVGGFERFLLAAFEEGEGVCISRGRLTDDDSVVPDVGVTLDRDDWLERVRRKGDITRVESTKLGLYVRMNPMRIAKGTKNLNDDVTDFRHVLVEFDTDAEGDTIEKSKQFGMMIASDLPITAVIDSGNKSLHAWVRVDAEDAEQYRERADIVYALFEDVDGQNHNPNRLSRAPDGFRTVGGELKRQRLIELNLGAPSFDAWEAINTAKAQGERHTVKELLAYDVPNDPNKVLGNRWLCKGGSLVIVAPSGIGKSALTTQLGTGWAANRPDLTFGIKGDKPLKQIVFQAENDKGDLAEGLQGVIGGSKFSEAEIDLIDRNLLYQTITTLTGEDFLHAVEGFVKLERPDLCWIDPLLNFLDGDASKQETIAEFCVKGLNRIAKSTGTIFALIHHTAKPKSADARRGQTSTDLAYEGFGSSGLTNWSREIATISRIETEDEEAPTFRFTCTKRRLRAGMTTLAREGEGGSGKPTDHIFIKHSVGRIAWVQCPKPEDIEEDKRGRGKKFKKGESGNEKGRPSSLTSEQRLLIAEAVTNNGGDSRISVESLDVLARKIGKSPRSVRRYLADIAEKRKVAEAEIAKGL